MSPDLTVRGAGVFGLATAHAAAARGARVRVVDPGGIGAGASGGVVGALAPHAPPDDAADWTRLKAVQVAALAMAPAYWAGIHGAGGVSPGFARAGRLHPLADAAAVEVARRRAAAAAGVWPAGTAWEVIPATGDPWEPVSPTGLLVRDTLSARLAPRAALAALAAALRAMGGEIVAEAEADASPTVWATGAAGLQALSGALGRRVGSGQKGQAARLALAMPPGTPQLYAGGLHIVPHADGSVAVGSTSEGSWTDPGPDARLDEVIARARAACPALAAAPVIERWAGLRPRPAGRTPVVGQWPGRPGHFVANGGFKIGFALAPWIAPRIASLALGEATDLPADWQV